ncbi:AraC family transcriptional regulator [Kiloniella sp. EL199]|uniref:AraC family transcriptional regulator n=1 Tax=Kiloniella sp. EL199 TaxID=2107581 RepID=UPI000EA1FEBF|nr:AraC family transcriptional regulator [Kiloniella sp. EL199]
MPAKDINSDLLSEVFSTLRLRSQLYFKTDFKGPYAIELPHEQRRIRFHLVLQGQCWLTPNGMESHLLNEGDLVIVPDGVSQIVSHSNNLDYPSPVTLSVALEQGCFDGGVLSYGEGEGRCRLLCGFCQFDEDIDHPILINLPPLLILNQEALGPEPWTSSALKLLKLEAEFAGQGARGILARLLEIILIQLVRRLSLDLDYKQKGFIAALSDIQLSKALNVIHQTPQKAWTVNSLAQIAGMSRARFSDYFTRLVGLPPIEYLTLWRLMRARLLLSSTDYSIDRVAELCGYASTPSFSSRFKRQFGQGPGTYRRRVRDYDYT